MNAELVDIINIERQRYVDYFTEGIAALRQRYENFTIELPVQINDETLSYPFNIIRVDFIAKDGNNEHSISELRLDKNLDYATTELIVNKLKLTVKPFCWNSCEFQVDKTDKDILKDWIDKWLKIDEDIYDNRLSLAIHSFSEPVIVNDKFSFVVDFGTATKEVFFEFIEVLNKCNTTEAIVQTTEV